jgi:hypothetical protein
MENMPYKTPLSLSQVFEITIELFIATGLYSKKSLKLILVIDMVASKQIVNEKTGFTIDGAIRSPFMA